MAAAENKYFIRKALPEEFYSIGQLLVHVYAALPGMPTMGEQPDYYAMLGDVAKRASNPAINVFVAVDPDGHLLGCVDFIHDMTQYGSGGPAKEVSDAAGIRLLAVDPQRHGQGIGKALTLFCIEQARQQRKEKVILHSTKAMQIAWKMYEALGFKRFPKIDFQQGALDVFGFALVLRGEEP